MEHLMPAKTTPADAMPGIDPAAYEDAVARIHALNERLIESPKAPGLTTLDSYEKPLQSRGNFEQNLAGPSQLDWVSALASTYATFVQDVSAAYTRAAREML